uniref:Uncharacterized protein n=1 Tax=Thermosporothrix sp. COM3 TaxID=2490863 RepID=A0A455SSU9_9CHLR|nr:hypothetical protein KTC_49000 [Thermosporothrix sp. COM3]BBH90214.1 hypothetical protein KTC_49650 [Thermosporothrix sp. COM3]BBH90279.1 hypothetical protein KTC_50300 [Thermosporothrix sp. COM3]
MIIKHMFLLPALIQARRHNTSVPYMRDVLYMQYKCKQEQWNEEQYQTALLTLAFQYPADVYKHVYKGDLHAEEVTEEKAGSAR